jgi:vacuolar-type H+-ATPase subunit C/Vma6
MRVRAALAATEAHPRRAGRMPPDLDRLTAGLHGRRARMAEGERLDDLCGVRTLGELGEKIFPRLEPPNLTDFQRLVVQELVAELSAILTCMSGSGARLLHWVLVRFQFEDLKILIRTGLTDAPQTEALEHLVSLPPEVALDVQGLMAAEWLEDFIEVAPQGVVRRSLKRTIEFYRDHPQPFFFEGVLDQGYFEELLSRCEELPADDREILKPLFRQEVDIYHLMLVTRGRFHYGLTHDLLLPLHVSGTRLPLSMFSRMLTEKNLASSLQQAANLVFDAALFDGGSSERPEAAQPDALRLERLLWARYLGLANHAFRKSHMGLAAVFAYASLRRMEVANLITLSEGVRKSLSAETIRSRMIGYREKGGARV